MALAAARRRYEALHKDRPYHDGSWKRWSAEASELFPFHFSDGVHLWVSEHDLTPDDDFLTRPAPEVPR